MRLSSWILFFPFSQLLFPIAIALACVAFRVDRRKNVLAHPGWTERGGGQHFFYVTRQFALCPIHRPSLDRCVLLLAHPRRAGDRGLSTRTRAGASNDKRGGMRVSPLSSLPPSPPLSLNLVVETRGSVTPLFRHRARPDIVICEIHRITPQ